MSDFHDFWIISFTCASCNQRGLNQKGIGPMFSKGDQDKEIGLWSDVTKGRAMQIISISFWKKEELSMNLSSLAVICPWPILLLLQVYFPFLRGGSNMSKSTIRSSIFSPKGYLTINPPLFSSCDLVVLKSPAKMEYSPAHIYPTS